MELANAIQSVAAFIHVSPRDLFRSRAGRLIDKSIEIYGEKKERKKGDFEGRGTVSLPGSEPPLRFARPKMAILTMR